MYGMYGIVVLEIHIMDTDGNEGTLACVRICISTHNAILSLFIPGI